MTVLHKPVLWFLAAFIFLIGFGACEGAKDAKQVNAPKEIPEGTLAVVNGVPIGEADIGNILKRNMRGRTVRPELRQSVLEMLIRQELMAQKAVDLGLDKQAMDDNDQKQIQRLEAELKIVKRRMLAKRFRTEEIYDKAVVTEDELKTFYDENLPRIRTELHVQQILYNDDEKSIEDDLNDIKNGVPFEAVAKRHFPKLPENMKRYPWDLGYLRWNQIPAEWQDVIYGMKKGDVSGRIRGPGDRVSIIKLVDIRENADADFETSKPAIEQNLRMRKIEALTSQWEKNLRDDAEIVYYTPPQKDTDAPMNP